MAKAIRVMLAEDEFIVAFGLKTLLERMGYQVVGTAWDGNEAVALTDRLHPDVVLMDIAMPGVDGIAATKQIMDRCPTPVIILSAHDDSRRMGDAQAAGAVAYLFKPVVEEDLRRTIAEAVGPRS